jgi:hypothetical protein
VSGFYNGWKSEGARCGSANRYLRDNRRIKFARRRKQSNPSPLLDLATSVAAPAKLSTEWLLS